jgi:hypothetical protein
VDGGMRKIVRGFPHFVGIVFEYRSKVPLEIGEQLLASFLSRRFLKPARVA